MTTHFFESLELAPPDSILSITAAFAADSHEKKVNLSVGLYFNEKLETPIMEAVKIAEERTLRTERTKEYLPIQGDRFFVEGIGKLVFGKDPWNHHQERIVGVQAPGGTGAIRVAGEFLRLAGCTKVAISKPTWPNHRTIFHKIGMAVVEYPYYDFQTHRVDFPQITAFLRTLSPRTIVVLHTCCHNPTGADFSQEQWKELSQICLEGQLFPLFDFAYQGFGKGVEEDAYPIKLFLQEGHELAVATSQSKNFGLYGERTGALYFVCEDKKRSDVVMSQVKTVIRALYSNPPRHGAILVAHILQDENLETVWHKELDSYRIRLQNMRSEFVSQLATKVGDERFSYLERRSGFFCYMGLNSNQRARLQNEYGIYMVGDGRINVAGLIRDNLDFVTSAIAFTLGNR